MSLRLPIPTRNVRRVSRVRRMVTVCLAATVFVLLPLRLLLAIGGVATWTTAWRTLELLTWPVVAPFSLIGPFERTVLGNATMAEIVALFVCGAIATYFLALLTVRRQP